MRKPLEAFTAEQLRDMDFPPLFEPVPSLLCEGVHILAGRPKAGKSQLILQLAVAMANGHKALGMYETHKVGVVYLALEDGDRRLQRRIKAIGLGWPEWLVFRTKVAPTMDQKMEEIRYLLDGFGEEEPAVLFVDTWARFRPAKNGRDPYQDDYEPMSRLATLGQQRPRLTIVVVHHTKKLGDEAKDMEVLEQVSGSYGLTGAADGIMLLERATGTQEANLTIISRDTEERSLLMRREGELWVCQGEGKAGMRAEDRAVMGAVAALGGSAGPAAIAGKLGQNYETIKKRLQRMVEDVDPVIARRSHGLYVLVNGSRAHA